MNVDQHSRELLLSEYVPKLKADKFKFTEDQYCFYDYMYKIGDLKVIGEQKNRRCKSTTYPDTMLEKQKYDKLVKAKDINGDKVYAEYTVLFEDCYYSFDLNTVNIAREETKRCPKTTDFNRTSYTMKECVFFNLQDGIKYNYEGN